MESNQRKINVVLGLMVATAVMQGFMLRRSLSTAEKAVQEQETEVKDRMHLLAGDLERLGDAVNGVTAAAGRFSSSGAHQIDGTLDDFNRQLQQLNRTFDDLSTQVGKEYATGSVHNALARYDRDLADAGAWVADQNRENGTVGAALKGYGDGLQAAGTAASETTASKVDGTLKKYDERLDDATAHAETTTQAAIAGSLKKYDDALADAGYRTIDETSRRVDDDLKTLASDLEKAGHKASSTATAGVEDYFRPNGPFQRAMEAKADMACSCTCDKGRVIARGAATDPAASK